MLQLKERPNLGIKQVAVEDLSNLPNIDKLILPICQKLELKNFDPKNPEIDFFSDKKFTANQVIDFRKGHEVKFGLLQSAARESDGKLAIALIEDIRTKPIKDVQSELRKELEENIKGLDLSKSSKMTGKIGGNGSIIEITQDSKTFTVTDNKLIQKYFAHDLCSTVQRATKKEENGELPKNFTKSLVNKFRLDLYEKFENPPEIPK